MVRLKGNLLNEKAVERGQDELRVIIRPIYCMDCGQTRPPLAFNVADSGYIPEEILQNALSVSVCPECVKGYAEDPEGGWWENHLGEARKTVDTLIDTILKEYECETLEELNDKIGQDNQFDQRVANELNRILDMLDMIF